ncbi:hypothetical protein [Streptomyces sp.]|uniref:hypothetical protein n=1 Tax=Streptomyces sp. TaxID=1931 RepID=UPI002F94A887
MADAILLISAFVAQAALNALVWWKWGRDLKAHNVHLAWQVARLLREQARVAGERDAAHRAWVAAETENESLRARNDMLTGLVGGGGS